MKSGFGRRRAVHLCSSSAQKSGCWCRSFGAYTLISLISMSLCHFSDRKIALPGISVWKDISFASITSLFITKATPAEAVGLFMPGEFKIVILWWYSVETWSARVSDRWVSCSARIPIFCALIVLITAVHFEVGPGPRCGEDHPFMFRVATLKFARKLRVWWSVLLFGCGCGNMGGVLFRKGVSVAWARPCGSGEPSVCGSSSSLCASLTVGAGHIRGAGTGVWPKAGVWVCI